MSNNPTSKDANAASTKGESATKPAQKNKKSAPKNDRRMGILRAAVIAAFLALAAFLLNTAWEKQNKIGFAAKYQFADPSDPRASSQAVVAYKTVFAEIEDIPAVPQASSVHASVMLPLPDRIEAYWFGGSREGAEDVQIWQSTRAWELTPDAPSWSTPVPVVNRDLLSAALKIRIDRIGNPVVWLDSQGTTHMFVTTTIFGGWAASRIVHLKRTWGTSHFKPHAVLQISPFFNRSVLVRNAPVPLEDGGMLLPAYFEFGNKYPIGLRFSAIGELTGVHPWLDEYQPQLQAFQPSIVALSGSQGLMFLRDGAPNGQVKALISKDGGNVWRSTTLMPSLANPDSALAGVRLPDGSVALIHNPSSTERRKLVVSISLNGMENWNEAGSLEDGAAGDEYSYPYAFVIGRYLHISYTFNRAKIRHVTLYLE